MQIRHIKPKLKKVKAEIEKATKQSITLYGATIHALMVGTMSFIDR
jgi:hypothetical protein